MTANGAADQSGRINAGVHAVSRWIDAHPDNRDRDPEALLWGRVTKVGEEAGEVIAALVGATGHNPRQRPLRSDGRCVSAFA
ncbi:MazG-like family protein [Actinacidiphila glaucinigra]|uniref:MazG-like family protein n=1 Tax=Actinacidiphila glaucinigra TaxID=235986 RepID=UPI0033A3CC2F